MKKIMVALLMAALLVGTVSAQDAAKKGKVTFTADWGTDALAAKSYSGDFADADTKFTEEDEDGNDVSVYKGTGDFYLFTNPGLVLNKGEYRIAYEYTGDNFGALVQFKFDDAIQNLITGTDTSIDTLFDAVIGDVKLTGKLNDAISVELGNTAKRGIFGDYRYASFFGDGGTEKFDGFGIRRNAILNDDDATTLWDADIEVNNLDRNALGQASIGALLNVNAGPATISLASQFKTADYLTSTSAATPKATSKGNLGVRVELPKLADLVNLAVVYKVNFADVTKDGYPADGTTPPVKKGDVDGNALADHAFGIYGNLSPIEGLGVSLGYSGAFHWQENSIVDGTTYDGTGPLHSGIDLRVAYTAIDKTKIYFNNNFSFSSAKGDGDGQGVNGDKTKDTTFNGDELFKGQSQEYIVLTNTLGGSYALTEKLALKAQLGNTLAVGTVANSEAPSGSAKKSTGTKDIFTFYAGVGYAPNSNVSVHAGITLKNTANEIKVEFNGSAPPSYEDAKDGTFIFAIPVGLKVTF